MLNVSHIGLAIASCLLYIPSPFFQSRDNIVSVVRYCVFALNVVLLMLLILTQCIVAIAI